MQRDGTKEPQGPRLVATFFAVTGEHEGALCELARGLSTTSQQIGLTQCDHQRATPVHWRLLTHHDLIEKVQCLCDSPG